MGKTNLVREAFAKFEKAQSKYADYGAYDTEPRNVMCDYLSGVFLDSAPFPKPTTAEHWDLYTISMDCSEAAEALNHALDELEATLKDLWFKGFKNEIKNYLSW
jgi:hypothetical protein